MLQQGALAAAAPSKDNGRLSLRNGKGYPLQDLPVPVMGDEISDFYRIFHLREIVEQGGEEEVEDDDEEDGCHHRRGRPSPYLFRASLDLEPLICADNGDHNTEGPRLDQVPSLRPLRGGH